MTKVLVMFAGVNFLFLPVFVLLPLYLRHVLYGGVEWHSFLLAGSDGGALVGSAGAGALPTKARDKSRADWIPGFVVVLPVRPTSASSPAA